jgi:hypothetical protein
MTLIRHLSSVGSHVSRISRAGLQPVRLGALLWAVGAFALYFWYSQFVNTVGWNVIELLISNHLLHSGEYVTSLDYPSALTWRPVVPTLLVTAIHLFVDDPIRIYQIFCGCTFATLTACMFLAANLLGGLRSAHVAAGLVVSCPAITSYLIRHLHSYSHLGALWVLGPTLLVSIQLLRSTVTPQPGWKYAFAGVLWGLAYLCRSEMFLFTGVFVLGLIAVRTHWRWLALCGACFLVFFVSYNAYADYVSARDGLWGRKSIYVFYTSQGWVDPPRIRFDTEGEGYIYAMQLYGDPKSNDESLFKAITRNPAAFERRVRLNLSSFYGNYDNNDFVPRAWSLFALVPLLVLLVRWGAVPRRNHVPILFLYGLFAATNFILVYHIDSRYLTINIPALILLAAYSVSLLSRVSVPPAVSHAIVAAISAVLILAVWPQVKQVVANGGRRPAGVEIVKAAAKQYRALAGRRLNTNNREPHVHFRLPPRSLPAEDTMLFPYFTRTAWTISPPDGPFGGAWLTADADGAFPRGRVYAFRDCPSDFEFVPSKSVDRRRAKTRIVAETVVPGLGPYALLKPAEPRTPDESAAAARR